MSNSGSHTCLLTIPRVCGSSLLTTNAKKNTNRNKQAPKIYIYFFFFKKTESYASSRMAREKECIYREEKEFGRAVINEESMASQGLSPA